MSRTEGASGIKQTSEFSSPVTSQGEGSYREPSEFPPLSWTLESVRCASRVERKLPRNICSLPRSRRTNRPKLAATTYVFHLPPKRRSVGCGRGTNYRRHDPRWHRPKFSPKVKEEVSSQQRRGGARASKSKGKFRIRKATCRRADRTQTWKLKASLWKILHESSDTIRYAARPGYKLMVSLRRRATLTL